MQQYCQMYISPSVTSTPAWRWLR